MPFSLQSFGLHEMLRCGLDLRRATQDAASLEEAAQAVVRYLYDECVGPDGGRECALVRFYKTHPYGLLPVELQAFARDAMPGEALTPETRCLTLMATAGEAAEWNDRRQSRGHQAVPLPSQHIVEEAPMIAGLIRALGLEISAVVTPEHAAVASLESKTYNVFYVPEAEDSPLIPAQAEFVKPYGVRSVVGFGGLLLSGDLYAVILFARVPIPARAADRFRNIALDLRVALSDVAETSAFA